MEEFFRRPPHVPLTNHKEAKLNSHDAVHVAELLGDLLSAAVVQKVPQDLRGAEQHLSGRIRLVHVETDLLSSLCSQDQTTVHGYRKQKRSKNTQTHARALYPYDRFNHSAERVQLYSELTRGPGEDL